MFEGSLVESTALLQTRSRWPALLSFAAQALAALVIVAIPMLHPELLPMHAPSLSLVPPPPPHPPTPPPPQHVHASLASAEAPSAPSAPTVPPAMRSILRTIMPTAPSTVDTPVAMVGRGMLSDTTSNLGVLNATGSGPAVTAASPASPAHTGPVHLSTGVTAGLLLAPIQPAYPALARVARVEGTVVIRAIISRAGKIESAQIVSGPAMLQTTALQAVEGARYRPYLLNGEPTEVDTTVTITFHLGS